MLPTVSPVYSHLELIVLCPGADLDSDGVVCIVDAGGHIACAISRDLDVNSTTVHSLSVIRQLDLLTDATANERSRPNPLVLVGLECLSDMNSLCLCLVLKVVGVEAERVVHVADTSDAQWRLCCNRGHDRGWNGSVEVDLDDVRQFDVVPDLFDLPATDVDGRSRARFLVRPGFWEVAFVFHRYLKDFNRRLVVGVEILLNANNISCPDKVRRALHDRIEFIRMNAVPGNSVTRFETRIPLLADSRELNGCENLCGSRRFHDGGSLDEWDIVRVLGRCLARKLYIFFVWKLFPARRVGQLLLEELVSLLDRSGVFRWSRLVAIWSWAVWNVERHDQWS